MIEFNGYISGVAEQYMWKKARRFGIAIMYIAMTSLLPFVVLLYLGFKLSLGLEVKEIFVVYCSLYVVVPLLSLIPKSKKERKRLTTCKVFTDEEYIVALLGNGEEHTRLISDATKVNDYGEFYEIVFPIGKKSDSFICQKNLLTNGSLAEFEELFKGKITKTDLKIPK